MLPGAYELPRGFSILLDIDHLDRAGSVFRAFAEQGKVQVPPQETFWTRRYGKLVDRFGIAWEVNCPRPAAGS